MSGIGLALSGLNIVGKLTGVKAALAKVPPKVWLYAGIAVAAVALIFAHHHYAHKALKAADAAGYARAMNEVATKALAIKAKADALTAKIAADERNRNDEDNRRIAAAADDLRLRGPGKAACPGGPVIPGAARQYVAPGGAADAPVASVPGTAGLELIGLPFADTIDFGEDHDINRTEVLSWRDWYAKLLAAWPKSAGGKI